MDKIVPMAWAALARFDDEEGANMVEYALLVALVGVLLVGAIGGLTAAIGNTFGTAAGLMPA